MTLLNLRKEMSNLKNFGIWGNTDKKSFWEVLPKILTWSKNKGLIPSLTTRILKHENGVGLNQKRIKSKEDMGNLDFMLVLGGDGTFLSLARAIEHRNTPILGIHLGDLGFLAKVTLKDLFIRLNQVIEGDFIIEKRILAKASLLHKNKKINHVGLNDFVLINGESYRMLNTKVRVDSQLVGNYQSDGLIISTPTGSTAYSLSAGGPIVTPDVNSLIITPIAAHTLNSRPLVIPAESKIVIEFPKAEDSVLFIADGQVHVKLDPKSIIEVTKSDYHINLINFKDCDYFQTLRVKMGWGRRGDN